MQKPIKILFKGNSFALAIGITMLIGYLSLVRTGNFPIAVSHLDKLQHLFAYFVLALSWLFAVGSPMGKRKNKIVVALGCVIYGIVLEVLQSTVTTYRTASLLDVIANAVGVFMALLIFKGFHKKINAN